MMGLFTATLALLTTLCHGKGMTYTAVQLPLVHLNPHSKNGLLTGLYWAATNKVGSQGQHQNLKSVLFLHMYGGSAQDWAPLARELSLAGIPGLAIDFRNKGRDLSTYSFIEDIQSGVAYLKNRHSQPLHQVSIIAAGVGANGALEYATMSPLMPQIIDSLLLISPGESFGNMIAPEAIQKLTTIPVLFLAAADDQHTSKTASTLRKACKNPCFEVIYPEGGQGTNILKSKYGSKAIQTITQFVLNPRSYGTTR